MHQYATLEDTVYLWFAANDTSGSGADGETPVFDVRLAGAAADAAPVLSGAATLLSHANYPAGCHEIAVAATAANGFVAGNTYAVFCTLLVDSQNPTGFHGSFTLGRIPATCPDTQKVDLNTIKTQTVNAAGTVTFPGSVAATGGQMDFVDAPNATALTAIGAKVEAMVLDEADATALLAAIAAKIETFLINEGDATATLASIGAAVKTAMEAAGTKLTQVHAKLPSRAYLAGSAAATGETQTDAAAAITAASLATSAELAKVPKSDGTATWNSTALASINAEVDTALNTAIPGSPMADSINERVATMDGRVLGTLAAGTHTAQSGDSFARLGAPAGASIAADIAAAKAVLDTAAADVANIDGAAMRGTDGAYTGTPPTAGAIADAVLDEATAGHVTPGTLGKAIVDTLEDTGTTIPALIAAIEGGAGTGNNTIQFEITNSATAALLENATITLRLNGVLKATGDTGATGRLASTGLAVNATGTYELSVTCDDFNGYTADLVVTAGVNTMVEVGLTAVAITPPANPTDCACGWVCLNDADAPTADIIVRARPDTDATGDGYAWSGHTRSATSVAGTGLATIALPQGSKWWVRAGSGEEELYTVPATATALAGSIRGGKRDTY